MSAILNLRNLLVKARMPVRLGREEETPSAQLLEMGDFRIDTVERTARLRGHDLPLTSEEFDVLVFLANHPRHLVTPHTMLATKDLTRLRQTAFLKALMSLRAKLELAGAGKRYLRTEPWVIYRFDPTSSCAV